MERRILAIEGVEEAILHFSTSKLYVKHWGPIEKILSKLEEIGHSGILLDDRMRRERIKSAENEWYQDQRIMTTLISGLLFVLGLVLSFAGNNKGMAILFYLLAIISGGYDLFKKGINALNNFTLDMNFLITIAIIGAVILGEWSEGAAVVFLFSVGNALQIYTMDQTRKSIETLMELAPNEALIKTSSGEILLPVEELAIGDVMLIKPGSKIPLDGIVIKGYSFVNQAPITGESIPAEKRVGDEVFAGTINEQGFLEVRATRLVKDTTLMKIIEMVEEAQSQKAPAQQWVDRFANYYTPIVVSIAILISLIPPILFGDMLSVWVKRALILLVISCPCALVISTPVTIVSAIANASKQGILVKGGTYLEEIGKVKAIAFDKTGTLTEGKPILVDMEFIKEEEENDFLQLAAVLEKSSEHPIGKAFLNMAKEKGIPLDLQIEDFQSIPGKGIMGKMDGKIYYLGSVRLFQEYNIGLNKVMEKIQSYQDEGKTVILLGTREQVLAVFTLVDMPRKESQKAIQTLKRQGIKYIVMLTGDHHQIAFKVTKQVGIEAYKAQLLPGEKLNQVKHLIQKYGSVAMIGDGINDAPALAAATVGIAMGVAGTDAALETADIALMGDDLGKISYLISLSRKALRVVKENIWFSLILKLLFISLTFMDRTNLWMAVFADTGASILVILNGMRLIKHKFIG